VASEVYSYEDDPDISEFDADVPDIDFDVPEF
jgi:hypothetical protein